MSIFLERKSDFEKERTDTVVCHDIGSLYVFQGATCAISSTCFVLRTIAVFDRMFT